MKAYKGFNKDMTCRGFQLKEGELYEKERAQFCKLCKLCKATPRLPYGSGKLQ